MRNILSHISLLVPLLFAAVAQSGAQQSSMNYQVVMMDNPALTGLEGNGYLRLSYLNLYPGNSYDLHNIFLSYDGYFPSIHGGAGFYLSDKYLGGLVNDLNGGFSYSYFFQAGNDIFISAGLSAAFFHRAYSLGGIILPDQIDPLRGVIFPTSEVIDPKRKTVLDIATGITVTAGLVSGGLSVSHLTQPDMSATASYDGRIRRKLMLYCTGEIPLTDRNDLKIRPVGKAEISENSVTGGAGFVLESTYLSVNALVFRGVIRQADIQSGLSINVADLSIFYNYSFNISGGSSLLPLSVYHHTGVALRLNNVDKRKTVKTINFPKL